MVFHNFKYSLKVLLKNKMLVFWTFAFPIILGTFFNMAFSDIEDSEKLDIIDIAIVKTEEFNNNELVKESFKVLSDKKNEEQLFNVEYVTEEKAKELLEKEKITGYLLLDEEESKIFVKENGINETIFKYITEEIIQNNKIINNVVNQEINKEISSKNYNIDYKLIYKNAINLINKNEPNIKDISSSKLSYTMIEFYTLIAMACLYGGILGMVAVSNNLANMSNTGKRVAVSKTSKIKLILSSVFASYVVQIIGVALLFLYTAFVLGVDYGNNLILIILLALLGSFAGLTFGIAIACIFKVKESVKTGILISITMLWCFLSGMMGITMKYIVDKNIPIINKINPASMITDGFYSLYYYDTLNRYYLNITGLIIFSILMIGVSIFSLRRQKYDSV